MKVAVPKSGSWMPFTSAEVNRVFRADGVWWADVGRGVGRIIVPRRNLIIIRGWPRAYDWKR